MPRKISSAIQSRNVSTQTPGIVRSRTRAKRVPECHDVPRTAAKQSVSRLPTPTVVRIQARYVAGENQTQIAKAEGCDRETVSRIVRSSEMVEYIEQMKEEFRGLVPDALNAIRYALCVQKDARIAYEVLRNVGIAPRSGETEQLPTTPSSAEERVEKQMRMIAGVMLSRREVFGIELPSDIQEALDQGEAAETELPIADKHPAGEQ
jgi:hypothetical protein